MSKYVWIEGNELVIVIRSMMFIIGPRTLSLTFSVRGNERGFFLHPGQSCWMLGRK